MSYQFVNFLYSAGADFVMAGGMFAGHDQSGGELVERDGKKYKLFYGMSSNTAMQVIFLLITLNLKINCSDFFSNIFLFLEPFLVDYLNVKN